MKTITINNNIYKIIYKQYLPLGDYNDGERGIELYIASLNGVIYEITRRFEHVANDDNYDPIYKYSDYDIKQLCKIEEL